MITACAYRNATFGADGFHELRYEYDVRYADPANRQIMPADWRLDNYATTESGLEPKSDAFYETTFKFDTDKNGGYDAAETVPTFELRFEHTKTKAVTWLRTIPALTYETSRSVYSLGRYTDGIATAGYERAQFSDEATPARKYAVQILQMREAKLASIPALALTIEVADLAALKRSPQAPRTRVKLVLMRTGNTRPIPARDYEYETIFIAGYASRPDAFEAQLRDFDRFLGQIVFRGHSGYSELQPR
jgi:hypothetical protein